MGIRDRVAQKLREAADKFQKTPAGLYMPQIEPEPELLADLKGRGHYDLYPRWIKDSVDRALEASGPVGEAEVEESCGYVIWQGKGEDGSWLGPPVLLCGYRDMMERLDRMGMFNNHTTVGQGGSELQVNGERVREQIDKAECTRKAGALLVVAWNAKANHPNLGMFHCSMHARARKK